ncbi:TPA: hypothetical protein JA361_14515 [Legionella pneumophila]|nr:hypothetical protein [Legionella pneumophila]HAT8182059.1 hypothetical protein [Legionella pneumophila]
MESEQDKVKQSNIKRFKELHHQKERQLQEDEEYNRLFSQLRNEMIAHPESLKEEVELNYVFSEDAKPDLIELLKDYKEEFGKEPIQHQNGFALSFKSQEEAVNFFKSQSEKGRAFDMYNASIDHRVYSDGKGAFVHGTNAEVTDYLKNKEKYDVGKDGALTKIDDMEHGKSMK